MYSFRDCLSLFAGLPTWAQCARSQDVLSFYNLFIARGPARRKLATLCAAGKARVLTSAELDAGDAGGDAGGAAEAEGTPREEPAALAAPQEVALVASPPAAPVTVSLTCS